MKESWVFGTLISATDPVSVLAIFKEMNVNINLYSLIFGESIFNDVISIVLYRAITESEFSEGEQHIDSYKFRIFNSNFLAGNIGPVPANIRRIVSDRGSFSWTNIFCISYLT